MEEVGDEIFTVYPNPSTGEVHFNGAADSYPIELEVTDVSGRLILKQKITSASDVVKIPSTGAYYARFKSGNSVYIEKLIINE
jgi:hypothetical protein